MVVVVVVVEKSLLLALDHIPYAEKKRISKWQLQLTEDSMFFWEILVLFLTGSQLQWNGVLIAPLDRIFRRRDTYSEEKLLGERDNF